MKIISGIIMNMRMAHKRHKEKNIGIRHQTLINNDDGDNISSVKRVSNIAAWRISGAYHRVVAQRVCSAAASNIEKWRGIGISSGIETSKAGATASAALHQASGIRQAWRSIIENNAHQHHQNKIAASQRHIKIIKRKNNRNVAGERHQ